MLLQLISFRIQTNSSATATTNQHYPYPYAHLWCYYGLCQTLGLLKLCNEVKNYVCCLYFLPNLRFPPRHSVNGHPKIEKQPLPSHSATRYLMFPGKHCRLVMKHKLCGV